MPVGFLTSSPGLYFEISLFSIMTSVKCSFFKVAIISWVTVKMSGYFTGGWSKFRGLNAHSVKFHRSTEDKAPLIFGRETQGPDLPILPQLPPYGMRVPI